MIVSYGFPIGHSAQFDQIVGMRGSRNIAPVSADIAEGTIACLDFGPRAGDLAVWLARGSQRAEYIPGQPIIIALEKHF